jgi:hypothetical protein
MPLHALYIEWNSLVHFLIDGIIAISPYLLSYLFIMSLFFMLFYYLNLSITLEDFNTVTLQSAWFSYLNEFMSSR